MLDQFNASWALQQAVQLTWILPGAVTVGERLLSAMPVCRR